MYAINFVLTSTYFKFNNVIYKQTYVGQTKRQLQTRLKEHKNNLKLDPSKHSVISEHISNFNHTIDWEKCKNPGIRAELTKD